MCYRVADYDAGKRWFVEKLDFRVVVEWPFGTMQLGYLAPPNDDHALIELIGDGDPAPANPPPVADLNASFSKAGAHHYNFAVASVEQTIAELRARGVTIVAEPFVLDAIARKLAFFADPFGNLFEVGEVQT